MKNLLLLLLPSISFATCKTGDVVNSLFPTAQWIMTNDDFSTVDWQSKDIVKPTLKTVTDAVTACKATETADNTAKDQARVILKSTTATDKQKLDAIIKVLDLAK